jgi:predicted nuclease with TOPRIM domain
METRRLSDSSLQRFGIHKVGPETHSTTKQSEAFTIDDTIEAVELRVENMKLLEELEKVKVQRESAERETDRLHKELARTDDQRKKTEHELHTLRDSRGKILRGLNTQTEIALAQLKRDFENMRKQLLAKDEIISVQERKIASLIEANSTLRSGLQDLLSLPKDASGSEEEGEGEETPVGLTRGAYPNGHHANTSPNAHSTDLFKIISLLDSGKFDQS